VGSLSLSKNIPLLVEDVVYTGGQFRLPNHKIISVKGDDAQTFLNNQTTNDVSKLADQSFHLNSVLDLSAKIVGFFELLKTDENEFYIVTHVDIADAIVERLEKYLIAEDVEIEQINQSAYGIIGTRQEQAKGWSGIYAGEKVVLNFGESDIPLINQESFHTLKVLTGYPVWGETIHESELINNTTLIDLAYNKDKGCFLGQETVSKIETRRGAAFKPVVIELNDKININSKDILKIEGKKVGKVQSQADSYLLASLNRESRIEGLKVSFDSPFEFEGVVKNLPIYKSSEKSISFYYHGVELFQEGNEEEAEKYLLKSIEVDPTFEDAYESLGVLYGRQERYKEAIAYMEKLSKLNQKSVMAHTNMSLYYMKIGEIEKAEDQKAQATIKQFEVLGDEADRKRRLEEEEKKKKEEIEKREGMYRQVLEIDPEDTLANYGLGEIELEKGLYQDSISHLKKAIEHKKNYSVAWLALGKAYMQSGEKELALETFREGIKVAGKNGDLMPANEMQRLLGLL
tara:strand:- start:36198 stop:37745 length:1548 start_codon:yes stop_codon:yes gene_type:complete